MATKAIVRGGPALCITSYAIIMHYSDKLYTGIENFNTHTHTHIILMLIEACNVQCSYYILLYNSMIVVFSIGEVSAHKNAINSIATNDTCIFTASRSVSVSVCVNQYHVGMDA